MKTSLLLLGSLAKCRDDDDEHAPACVHTAAGGLWMNLDYRGIYHVGSPKT